jgi:hypothetical protein
VLKHKLGKAVRRYTPADAAGSPAPPAPAEE